MEDGLEGWITRKVEQKVGETLDGPLRDRIRDWVRPMVREVLAEVRAGQGRDDHGNTTPWGTTGDGSTKGS